ncbi:MAG: phosphoribosylformylglycinamidine cyclo-ligase [Helicobacter sp.]|nr:phosphoribosylformylglycinamidine cyclo-ligase [Helicobacter sp.]
MTYADSGVDIDAGNALVKALAPLARATYTQNVIGEIGSFAGAFAIPKGYADPVLLAATDGVGTKLRLALERNELGNVGIDLVAMCANDLICNFATPLFFLDYYATGKLNPDSALLVISGIAKGCKESGCALLGGETAEMPGMYAGDDFDLAGFAVGIAEREETHKKPEIGDVLVGIPSSGLHSNGFSLVRKILQTTQHNQPDTQTLLAPTRIYVPLFLRLREHINALAHITGGGIVENLPRILQPNQCAHIRKSAIPKLPVFEWLREFVAEEEAYRTFNMGVGMILAIRQQHLDDVLAQCDGCVIGEIHEGRKGVVFE